MGHIPYVPSGRRSPQSNGANCCLSKGCAFRKKSTEGGVQVGPKKPRGPWLRRRHEDGAETVEFAIVVVLLITLIYGIVSVGLSLAAKVTITQAAADGARAGIVMTTASLQAST